MIFCLKACYDKTMDIYIIWLVAGAAAAILEILIPGFFMLSVTAGCIGGFIASLLGLSLLWQLIFFLVLLIAFALLIRPLLYKKKERSAGPESKIIGNVVTVTKDIRPPDAGRGMLYGVEWTLSSEHGIKSGERARVKSVGGAVLYVEKVIGDE